MFPLCSIRNLLCWFVFFLPLLKTINCYSSSDLKLSHVGVGYCLLTLTVAPHETLTEADKSISHPLIALLVSLLGLTAEVPGFSQRPNNTSMLQHLISYQVHSFSTVGVVKGSSKNNAKSMQPHTHTRNKHPNTHPCANTHSNGGQRRSVHWWWLC